MLAAMIRYAAGAMRFEVTRMSAMATMGAVPPNMPMPIFNVTACALTRWPGANCSDSIAGAVPMTSARRKAKSS